MKTLFTFQPQFRSASKSEMNNYFIIVNEGISKYFKLKILNSMTSFAGLISKWKHLPLVFIEINLNHIKKFPISQFLIFRV